MPSPLDHGRYSWKGDVLLIVVLCLVGLAALIFIVRR
jgi:hypothetical protein